MTDWAQQVTRAAINLQRLALPVHPPAWRGVLAFTGPPGTGKTELAAALAGHYLQCRTVSFGTYVRDEATRTGEADPNHRLELIEFGQHLVEARGARKFTDDVLDWFGIRDPATLARPLVVDDVYHLPVFDELARLFREVRLIALAPSHADLHKQLLRSEPATDVEPIEHHAIEHDLPALAKRAHLQVVAAEPVRAFEVIVPQLPELLASRG